MNRDFLDATANKLDNKAAQMALVALSPAAFGSLRLAQNMPDHRDPTLITAGTNVAFDDLIAAMQSNMIKQSTLSQV